MKLLITGMNITKKYGDKIVLNNVNFSLPKGKIVALLGHNGAGKTTLIKCILQLIQYDGTINYDFDEHELYKNINVQMQTTAFESNARVGQICKLYKDILSSNINIDEILEEFGLLEHKKSIINKMSGGEKQKLSVLLTLFNNPKVIIYDELTTGLDIVARKKIWDIIKRIQETKGVTILMTSHFLDEIEYLSDEVIILEKGEVKLVETVKGFVQSVYGNRKKITCSIASEEVIQYLRTEKIDFYQTNDHSYSISIDKDFEEQIIRYLYDHGVKDISFSNYSFEEAFLERFGYRLDEKGEREGGK